MKITQNKRDICNRAAGFSNCYALLFYGLKDALESPHTSEGTKEFLRGFLDGMRQDQKEMVLKYANDLAKKCNVNGVLSNVTVVESDDESFSIQIHEETYH